MNIFKAVSDTISGILHRRKSADPVNKHDILALIENNIVALRVVVDTYSAHAALFARLRAEFLGANKDNAALQDDHDVYVRALSPTARALENAAMLKSLYVAATLVLADHERLRDQFDVVFKSGTDDGEITLEQMRLSHAVVFGFINLSSLLADWYGFFVGQIVGRPEEAQRAPAYRLTLVRDATPKVADFVNDVVARGPGRTVLTLVQSVRAAGDVAIYTSASTLDSYANINDYASVIRYFGPFNSFQPVLWLRDFLGSFSRAKYNRALAMRDWLQAKIVILQMDADKMSPESPEYQRQKQLVQRYSDKLATCDRKIADYEQG